MKLSLKKIIKESSEGRMIVYHATKKAMAKPDKFFLRNMDFGPGLYFSTEPQDTLTYGTRIYRAEVQLNNPVVVGLNVLPDPKFVKAMQRALKIDDESLGFSDNVIAEIFGLARTLIDAGMISGEKFRQYLIKLGYDGVVINNDFLRGYIGENVKGDYVALFNPSLIISWQEIDVAERDELFKQYYGRDWDL